jgi:hypothetical protein
MGSNMSKRGVILDVKALCPTSGLKIGSKKIKPHYVHLTICKNGSLFGYCRAHNGRLFIGDMMLVHEIVGHATEIGQRENPNGAKKARNDKNAARRTTTRNRR